MAHENSRNFREDEFLTNTRLNEESRLDFKECVYDLTNEEQEFEFAKDIIAFANVARRIGKPCWLFFGVDNDERDKLYDVRNQHPRYDKGKTPDYWTNPNKPKTSAQKQEDVVRAYREVMEKWIDPVIPEFQLEYGTIKGKFISYLEIRPTCTTGIFKLKRSIVDKELAQIGNTFVRRGSSSVILSRSEADNLLPCNEAEYLSRDEWKAIIEAHTQHKFEEAFFLPPQYQPKVAEQDINVLDKTLEALKENKKTIIITGQAGEGKTIMLLRIAYELAQRHNQDMITNQKYFGEKNGIAKDELKVVDLEVVPSFPIPVFMELRASFDNIKEFKETLLSRIKELSRKTEIRSLDALFKIPGSRWIILLDGIDEIGNREEFANKLETWIHRQQENVQFILTSRPYAIGGQKYIEIPIAPLNKDDALLILREKIFRGESLDAYEDEDKQNIIKEIEKMMEDDNFAKIIMRQRAMDGLVLFLNHAYTPLRVDIDDEEVDSIEKRAVIHEGGTKSISELMTEFSIEFDDDVENRAEEENDLDVDKIQENTVEKEENNRSENRSIFPDLASMMKTIVQYMYDEEKKRKQIWGPNVQELADEAKTGIEQTAWHTEWSSFRFNIEKARQEKWLRKNAKDWNQDVGFISPSPENRLWYQFLSPILHKYFIAEYAYNWFQDGYGKPDDRQLTTAIRARGINVDTPAAEDVINLLNQLRIAEGYDEFQFTQGA